MTKNSEMKCAPKNESIDLMKDIAFRVAVLTQNFETDDFSSSPIKNQINQNTYIGLMPNVLRITNFKISNNLVSL